MAIVNATCIVIICNHYEENTFFCVTGWKKQVQNKTTIKFCT